MERGSLTGDFEGILFLHAYLCCYFLDLEDVPILSIGAIWNFGKGTGLL
jgi:hypothetical protein